ncbi:MAG: aspartate kinase [Bacillota bacterium]
MKKKNVIKFGGVSLKNYKRVKNTAKIIKQNIKNDLVVVISAIGNSTNELIKAGKKAKKGIIDIKEIKSIHIKICNYLNIDFDKLVPLLTKLEKELELIKKNNELNNKDLDLLMSFGERLSVIVLSSYLNELNINAKAFNSWEIGLFTNSEFGSSEILETSRENINKNINKILSKDILPIVTGFIGKDTNDNITTLGRGGSDLSASYIASSINADQIILWKDVKGILSSNPTLVKDTKKLNTISFKEASEMAYYGAEVLHPQALFPAIEKDIEVKIKNFLEPESSGTIITNKVNTESKIRTISYQKDITMVHIESRRMLGHYGFLAKVFEIFDKLKISVDMISTSEVSISLTLDNSHDLIELKENLSKFAIVKIFENQSIISLIGNTQKSSTIFRDTFDVLEKENIDVKMISYGASNVNIGFIIDSKCLEKTVNYLHQKLILDNLNKGDIKIC